MNLMVIKEHCVFSNPQPEYTNVCFWYIPPSLREMEEGPEFWRKLSLVSNEWVVLFSSFDETSSMLLPIGPQIAPCVTAS